MGRTRRVNHGQMPCLVEGKQGFQGRMKSEKPIKIQSRIPTFGRSRNRNRTTTIEIFFFSKRNDEIQTVRATPEKDRDQGFLLILAQRVRHRGSEKEGGHRTQPDQRQCAFLDKDSSSDHVPPSTYLF